ncbi:hypothetical protein L1887_15777 [Cichorium endivia]|nr:hypothetical protein L1887_15777 [Cichorium endivia]
MGIYNTQSDFTEKMLKCQEYVEALEEERRKIRVFERELPLCLELVSQAIERCRQQMSGTIMDCFNGQSDQHSEQTSNDGPVLEEFIPIKRTSSTNNDDGDGQEQQKRQLSHNSKIICTKDKSSLFSTKPDWLTSTQLSIKAPDPRIEEDFLSNKPVAMETNRNGYGAFHPFRKTSLSPTPNMGVERSLTCPAMVPKAATSCSADTDGGGGSKGEDKGLYNKKERRCWSPELHRRFLHALQQLGGAHVATPKQIKELMKVDGLTNDEIKSHLQKYRLHTRRVSPTIHHNDPHPSQLVVVGRIWMPPLEYGTSSPASDNTNNAKGVFTPIASLPPSITASLYKTKLCNQQPHLDGKGSQSHSNSPSTSSMHTTTVSTAF